MIKKEVKIKMEDILKEKIKTLTPIQYDLIKFLLKNGTKKREEITKRLNKPRTTVYDNLEKLEKKKLILRSSKSNGKRGRPTIFWEIEQDYNSVSLEQVYILPPEQTHNLVLFKQNKPKKNKPIIKNSKIPKWIKIVLKKEVKFLTYSLKALEAKLDSNPIETRKSLDDKPSYIVPNRSSKLTIYTIDKINGCTYFRTATLSKYYVDMVLKIKNTLLEQEMRRSASNRIGRIIAELLRLGLIINHSNTARSTWKNLHKGNLHEALNEKIEEKYFTIKLKDDDKA